MKKIFITIIFKLFGWQIKGQFPKINKFLAIGGPHTSNWDFPIMLGVKIYFNLKLSYIGKHTLFKGPFGWFFRLCGGIPVDRNKRNNFVKQMAQEFEKRSHFFLAMSPSGTRNFTERWKSGFYYIALEANVPILLTYLCFKTKVAGIGPLITPSGDIKSDMQIIRDFYTPLQGRFPKRVSKIIVKEEF